MFSAALSKSLLPLEGAEGSRRPDGGGGYSLVLTLSNA